MLYIFEIFVLELRYHFYTLPKLIPLIILLAGPPLRSVHGHAQWARMLICSMHANYNVNKICMLYIYTHINIQNIFLGPGLSEV